MKIGCCGIPLKPAEYASRFPVAEVQHTFYQPPPAAKLQAWRAQARPPFEFTLKAWQLITHLPTSPTYERLRAPLSESERDQCGGFKPSAMVREAWLTTKRCAEILNANFVLFQCPASFTPRPENVENFRRFFREVNRGSLNMLWEPRGPWPTKLVGELCHELDLHHVVDPFLDRPVTRDLLYYRLHGGRNYQHRFTDDELQRLLSIIPPNAPVYVLFNNVSMLHDAERFQRMAQTERA